MFCNQPISKGFNSDLICYYKCRFGEIIDYWCQLLVKGNRAFKIDVGGFVASDSTSCTDLAHELISAVTMTVPLRVPCHSSTEAGWGCQRSNEFHCRDQLAEPVHGVLFSHWITHAKSQTIWYMYFNTFHRYLRQIYLLVASHVSTWVIYFPTMSWVFCPTWELRGIYWMPVIYKASRE